MKISTACMMLVLCTATANAQELRLVLPVGHTSSVSSAAFSKDGQYIVTASWDNTAKIWQASDGRLLYELKGHTASLTAAVFTPDGKLVITSSKDGTARIWTSPEGRLIHTLAGHKNWVNSVTVSANGKQLLTSSWDSTARLWDVRTGRLLKIFSVHSDALTSAVFSADDRLVITASRDSTAAVWDARSYKMMYKVKHNDWVNTALMLPGNKLLLTGSKDNTAALWDAAGKKISTLAQHSGSVTAADFNRDGTMVATASSDSSTCVWDVVSGKLLYRLIGHTGGLVSLKFHPDGKSVLTCADDSTARVWSVREGTQVAVLAGHNGPVNSAVFNNNGKFISTASADNTAKIWDVRKAGLVATLKGHTSVVTSASFSADGKYMVTASWDNSAKIWDATDGKLLTSLQGHTDWINSVEFSPDGRSVATASSDNTARIWSVPDGRLLHSLKGHSDWVAALSYSPDGKRLITTSWDQRCITWDVERGTALAEMKGHTDMVRSINFSPTGDIAITASWDHTAAMWNVEDGKLIRKLVGHRDKVRTASFSHDGKYILTSSWDSTARIWSAEGELIFILKGHTGPVNAAIFSPDDKYILTSSMDSTVRMWRAYDGALVRILEGHNHSVNWASYSPDGKQILTSSWDNSPKIWDAATGKLIHTLRGHSSSVKSATYNTTGSFIVTTSEDNTLRKWSAQTGDFLYSFFSVDSTGFLAIDADGHYDGSETARKLLYYVCGTDIVDIEQFKDLSWEPGLIGKLTGSNPEPITARKLSEIDICNFTPVVRELGFRNKAYHFSILSRRGGVGEFQVFVNGKLVSRIDPSMTPRNNGRYTLVIPERLVKEYFVAESANMVIVRATTKAGHMISRGASTAASTTGKPVSTPNMYVVSIGVSRYKEDKISLRYAAGDAMHFTSLMKSSGEKLLNTDGRQHVFTYLLNTDAETSRKPTKSSVRQLIDTIAARATANDILVIFFAGHGVLQAGQKNLYLLTSEATGFDLGGIAAEVAISTDELREWLRKIRANKQLLILDACNSGQAVQELQAFIGKRDVPADQQRALEHLKDKTGTFILCASAPGQSAYETSMYSQGLLTYSLLAGVKLGTGLRNNRFIDVTKWFQFASDFAKTQARELGARQDPQILGTASFEVGLVDKSVADAIRLPMKKVIFRRSRFIEDDELLSDDLELSVLTDQQLITQSETAKGGPLVFVPDYVSPESYSVRGKYSISGKMINCRVSVFRGKERLDQFDLTGSVEERETFARLIVERVSKYLNKQAAP